MKKIVFVGFLVFLVGCGMSESEKQQLASSTCNVISNAAGDDGATRLKELNSARGQLGEPLYSGSDDQIRDSVKFGICEILVLNDPAYSVMMTQNRKMVATEKKRINGVAAVTCSVMGETRNMDSAVRIREINAARVEIGEEPFLDGDRAIKEAFKYGLCEELVRNEMSYFESLSEMKRLERESFAAEQKALAAKTKQKQELLAAQKKREREQAERVAKEKEELERMPRQKWRQAIASDLKGVSLEFVKASYDGDYKFVVEFTCQPNRLDQYSAYNVVVFKNNLGTLRDRHSPCKNFYSEPRSGAMELGLYRRSDADLKKALSAASNPTELIEEIYVLLEYVSPSYDLDLSGDRWRKLDSRSYPPLEKSTRFKNPIRIDVTM
jgi:hypothetical protein